MNTEIGSQEWFDELHKRVKFPAKIAFYYDKPVNCINTRVVESKAAAVGNVRYNAVKPSALYFQSKDTALLAVEVITDARHFYHRVRELQGIWVLQKGPTNSEIP